MERLIFVVLMMVCSVSWADWDFTGRLESGEVYYHDKSTMRGSGAIVKMWIMVSQPNRSTKAYKVYDCSSEEFAIASVNTYSGPMGAGNNETSITLKKKEWKWEPVVPDSIVALEWKIACGKK